MSLKRSKKNSEPVRDMFRMRMRQIAGEKFKREGLSEKESSERVDALFPIESADSRE